MAILQLRRSLTIAYFYLTDQMIPSPIMNVSTPMPTVPMQSPRNDEELACMKKIEELRRYTDMIQRMIIKIGLDGEIILDIYCEAISSVHICLYFTQMRKSLAK